VPDALVTVGTQLAGPQTGTGAPVQAVPAVPAVPFISRGLNADIRSGDIIEEEAVPPPAIHGPHKN
jgi:hypothetical protein